MTGSTVRSVRVVLSASTAGYIAEMKRAGAATDGVAASMTASGARASAAQKSWALAAKGIKVASVGAAVGLVAAGKAAADFQSEMALVRTLSHATRPEMKRLEDQALHMGQAWGYSATQVASGQEELIKAGIGLKDILHGGLRGTLALAAAGQTDVATATEVAAAAMTQFKMKGKDVPHIADLLAAGADKALGSVTDLGDGLSQVGTTAHQFGFSIEETVGTLAEFAQAGLQGQRGGTVLNQMLLQLAAPTEKAQKLMDKYHLSLYDANGDIKTMSELAGNLQSSFTHLSPAQRNYALGVIFGSRAIRGANILLKDGAKANANWTRKVNDAGFAAQQASGKLDSLKGDWAKLKSVAQTGLIELGSGEQNPLRELVQNVTGDIKRLERDGTLKRWGREIGHTLDEVITKAGPLAHDVGHALSVVGHGIGTIVDGFNKLPDGVQHAIVTGAVVAYGAKKTGLASLAKTAVGGAGLVGRAGVVPVYVTNPGFGGPGGPGGKIGAAGGAAAGAAARGGVGAAESVAGDVALSKLLRGGLGKLIGIGGMIPGGGGVRIRQQPDGSRLVGLNSPAAHHALDAAKVRETAQALAKLGLSEKIVTAAAHGNAKAQAEVSTAMKNARDKVAALDKAQQRNRSNNGSLDEYTSRKHAIDDLTGAYNTVQHAINDTRADFNSQTSDMVASKRTLAAYDQALRTLPKKVQTLVRTPGAIDSYADIKRLARQYDLTPKQVRTLIQLSGVSAAAAQARAYSAMLARVNGQTATTYIRQVVQGNIAGGGHPIYTSTGSADGSTVPKTGRGYADRHLYLLADGEEVVSNRHGQADRNRPLLKAINAGRLADGGTAGIPGLASGGTSRFTLGSSMISVPGSGAFLVSAQNLAVAQAIAKAAREIADLGKDELKTARQTKVSRVDILHTMQSIRDTQRELNARHHHGKHKGQHVLTGLDRRTARAELADYRHQLRDARNARRDAIKQALADQRQARAEERKQIRQQAIEDQQATRQSTYDTLTGSLDLLGETTSATRAVSLVKRQTRDIAQYGQVVAQLRQKGASPLLLAQMQQHASSGDFRSAIRLGQALLAQPAMFKQLNTAYSQLGQVSGSVATFTTDPRFLAGGRFDPTGAAPKVVQVQLEADPSTWKIDIARIVKHEVEQAMAKVS